MQRIGVGDAAGSGTTAQISAAKGEYESFQIVVHAPASGLSNVNVSVSNLSSSGGQVISSSNVALFREQYVYVSASSPNWGGSNQPMGAGWYADGLIPFIDPATGLPPSGGSLKAAPFSVSANSNQPIWVDVFVPRGTTAGQYNGTFSVTSDQGSVNGQISLHVWNFTLPLRPTLQSSFAFFSANSSASAQELLRNKVAPLDVSPADQTSLIGNFGLGSTNLGYWSGANISSCSMSAPPSISQIQSTVAQQSSGLTLFDYSADEITSCSNLYSMVKQWGYNLHQAGAKNLVTMAPVSALFDDGSGTGRSAVDFWVVLSSLYNGSAGMIQQAQQKGDSVWSYTTLVQDPYTPKWEIDFAPINFRIQPGFLSQALNLTGLLYWRVDDWTSDQWHNVNNAGTFSSSNYPGEGALVYPGAPVGLQGVAPSMRLKWIRDGVEDYEYVALLKQAGAGSTALSAAQSVAPDWTNWTRDPNAVLNVRQQLGQQLDQLGGGSGGSGGTGGGTGGGGGGSTPPPTTTTGTPSGISVSPASGNGLSQTFTFTFSDTAGYQSLSGVNALVSTSTNGTGSCWIYYDAAGKAVWLASDDASTWTSAAAGSTGTLQNSQCSINAAGTSASGSGTNLTVQVPITFTTKFAGTQTVYLRAIDQGGAKSNFTPAGTWVVPQAVTLPFGGVSSTPASGNGSSQTFTFVYSDPQGYSSFAGVNALINTSTNGAGACWIYYDAVAKTLSLATDDASSWNSVVAGSSGAVQNSQCSIQGAGVSASGSGYSLTLQVPVTFTGSFAGGKTIYLRALDKGGSNSSFASVGSWTVPAAPTVTLGGLSVAPNSGTGVSHTFSFAYGDPKGYQSLSGVNALINTSTNGTGACWIYYDMAGRTVWLASDDASTWSSAAAGTAATLQNSQCSINAAGVSGAGSGTSFTIQVPITFKAAFTGGKTVYLRAIDTAGPSAFSAAGSWTVPVSAPLGAVSVSPNSGAGRSQTFALVLSDPAGPSQLAGGNLLVSTSLNGAGACWLYYDAAAKKIWLAHDDTANWDGATAGAAGTLSNSQCSINPQGVTASGTGSLLTVNIPITFSASFTGAKNLYGRAIDTVSGPSSFTQLGAWTVQ